MKKFYFRSLSVAILMLLGMHAQAQNCTVNAGVNQTVCPNQNFVLMGTFNGLFSISPSWSQISGPAVVMGTPIQTGNNLNVPITGYAPGNVYTFRLSAKCADGSNVQQTVTYTTLAANLANAGPNIMGCPTSVTLAGNTPGVGETGTWAYVGGANGTTINSPNSATSTFSLPANTPAVTSLRWTISNNNGCVSSDTVQITNRGGQAVNAGADQNLDNCYTISRSTNLNGSNAGNGLGGQIGTWTLVSGPNTPNISNVNQRNTSVSNLVQGTYVFRWTVIGPCFSGQDEVTITVAAPTQSVTNAGNATQTFCTNATSTVLTAPIPGFTNETGTWTLFSGAGTIATPNAHTTTITGLNPTNPSTFRYTIQNSVTGCTSIGTYTVNYTVPPTITTPQTVIVRPCDTTTVSIPYTTTGGNETQWALINGPANTVIGGVTGTTSFAATSNNPLYLTGLNKIGNYTFRLKRTTTSGQGGCQDAFVDVVVVISQPPTAANAGTDQFLSCNATATTLAGNTPTNGTGAWSQVNGPSTVTIANAASPTSGISNLTNGSYTMRWIITGNNGCPNQQDDVNILVAFTQPTTAVAGPDLNVCHSSPIPLNGNTPILNETGTWISVPSTGVTFIPNANDPLADVNGLAPGSTHQLVWQIQNACGISRDTLVINASTTQGAQQATAGNDTCFGVGIANYQLNGNAPGLGETGQWTILSGPNSPTFSPASSQNNATLTGLANGTYTLVWSLSKLGCTSTYDTVTITRSGPITIAIAGADQNLCGATSANLSGNVPNPGGGTGVWTQVGGPGGAVITSPLSSLTTVTGLTPGTFVFRWTIDNGACTANFDEVTINVSAPASASDAGTDQSLCSGTSTILAGNTVTNGYGVWSVVSGPNTPSFSAYTNPTATLSNLIIGTYTLKWVINNGPFCPPSEDTLIVNVTQPANATTPNTSLCAATDVLLIGNSGSAGTWTQTAGAATTITPNTPNIAIASGLAAGTYTYVYTIPNIGSCPQTTDDVTITVSGVGSVAAAGPDQQVCQPTAQAFSSVTLTATPPTTGTGAWSVIAQPTGSSPTFSPNNISPNATFGNLIPGVYLLQWNVTNGSCGTNGDIVRIEIFKEPSNANAGADQNAACASSITLAGNTPVVGQGTWTLVSFPVGGGAVIIDQPNNPATPILNATVTGAYTFRWTIASGSPTCPDKFDDVVVTVTNTPPTPSNAGVSQSVCNPGPTATTTLTGNSYTIGETGLWTVVSGPNVPTFVDATQGSTQVNGLIQGNYILRWTITQGSCTSQDTMVVAVSNAPTSSNAGTTQNVCLYSPVTLNGNTPTVGTGLWTINTVPGGAPTPVIINPTSGSTQVSGLQAGQYIFTWTISNGVCPPSATNVIVNVTLPPTQAVAGPFQTSCANYTVTMAATNPAIGTGTWTQTGGPASVAFTNANLYNTTVTGFTTAGVYTFQWQVVNGGCTSTDNTQVTIQPAIAGNAIAADQTICNGATPAALTNNGTLTGGNGTYSYQWQVSTTGLTGSFTNISGANSAGYAPGALSADRWYRRYVTSGACAAADTTTAVHITVYPALANNTLTAPIPASFCGSGDPAIILGSTPTGGNGIHTYQWQSSTTSGTTGFSNISGATAIDYDPSTVTVTTWFRRQVYSSGCGPNNSTAIQITVSPYPALTSFTNDSTCNNVSHTYTPTSSVGGTTYTWTRAVVSGISNAAGSGTGAVTETLVNTTNAPINVIYAYTLTAAGCTNPTQYYVTVKVKPTPTVTVPSNLSICNGAPTGPLAFTGSVTGTSFAWTNSNTAIGLAAANGTGNIASFNGINTGTTSVSTTITVTPSYMTCNGAALPFTITVDPTPALTSTTSGSVCSGNLFAYAPTATPTGAILSWTRSSVAGISNPAGSGTGAINETLINTTSAAVTVTYVYTISANGCSNTANVAVTVNPSPLLTSTLLPTSICDNALFSYTPTSNIGSGVTYSWSRAAVAGIANTAATGTGNPNENLDNTTTQPVNVTYVYTLSTVGCSNPTTYNVVVTVNPTPALTSTLTPPAICNSTIFTYNATSNTVGTTYTWVRPAIASINGNVGGSGSGANIGEVLTNSSVAPVNVTYQVTSSITGCTSVENVVVSVNPTPVLTSAASIPDICSGTVASYGPTSSTVGTIFNWSRAAVTGISTTAANGTGNPNEVLVNVTAAPITVTYVYSLSINGCVSSVPYNVTVVVKPTPILSSPQNAGAICSGNTFAYTPASTTSGSTFAWTRAAVTGISQAATSGSGPVSETLTNTTNAPVTVTYAYTITANGCVSIPYNVTILVNPTPALANAGAAPAICSNNTFSFVPASAVSGAAFNWTRAAVAGISNGATSGVGDPNEVLVNTTNAPVTVTYVYIVSANGCNSAPATVTVVVNPTPALTSTLSPGDICSNTAFNYPATSNVSGAIISWSRAVVAGINNTASTGTGDPNETLVNTTAAPVVVTYVYTVTANGCTSAPYNVNFAVKPSPMLSTTLTPAAICSNTPFTYAPASSTNGTVFTWSRALVAGISNPVASGSGNPIETLVNTTTGPVTAIYVYTLTANGCTNSQNVTVVVNPTPALNTPLTPAAICNNATFSYTAGSGVTGSTFSWTRTADPSINGGVGSSGTTASISEVLANNTNAPVAVNYVFTLTANGCNNTQTVTVMVNPSVNLTSTLTPPAVCDNATFSYVPASNVSGATFAWNRAAVTDIANAATTGAGNPNEALDNTSTAPVNVTYIYTVTANGCTSTPYNVVVTVKPTPELTSTVTPTAICSGTNFSYLPTSGTTGTVFNWSRAAVTGISNASAAGVGNPNEVLTNTTANPVNVTYVYSLTANGCTNLTTYSVVVTVDPSPILTSTLAPADICSGTTFNYIPTSTTLGATFNWSRAMVAGVTNTAATGIGNPNEVLTNNTTAIVNVTYVYTVTMNGCTSPAYNIVVPVKPTPALTSVTTPSAICNNTVFNYTPASSVTGATFAWNRATVAGIANGAATGTGDPAEQLLNTTVAPINVTYVYTVTANGCSSAPVNVVVSVNPSPTLTSTTTPPAICNNTTFNYTPTSGTSGTIFNWSRAAIGGISNTASSGAGNPAEILVNTTAAPINVTYVYTLSANSCANPVTYSVVVTVNPAPALTSSTSPSAICSGTTFSYVPASSTVGATFAWSRAAVAGISNGAAIGTNNPNETLMNTSAAPVIVTYVYTLSANGCTNPTTYNVMVTVNPTPLMTSPLTMPAICGSTTFNYAPASSTSGASFAWSRASVPGIANPAAAGSGNPAEVLVNNSTTPVTVTYVYTVSANGCSNPATYSVSVVVNPIPTMTSTATPPAICNNGTFNYTPTSNTTGVTFAWTRNIVAGISNGTASGTGNPAEVLVNTTPNPINVTYAYTLSANGCTNPSAYNVVVTVNPTPQLTSTLLPPAICHNAPFSYVPTSLTAGTTFAWSRAGVAGINGGTSGTGFGDPNEMLANSTSDPITVNYVYTLSANGCTNPATYTVSVVVNPLPILTSTLIPADVCDSTVFNYIPTSPTAGTIFTWSRAAVAGIVNPMATGTGNPAEMLINTTSGPVDVTYVYVLSVNGCNNPITYNVVVTVNPTPLLSTPVHLPSQCNNVTFAYTPTSPTAGTTFSWNRYAIAGISNAPTSGTNGISEVLVNTTPDSVYVTYEYALTANGCTHTQLIGLWVKPTPQLTSPLDAGSICNNITFNYTPVSPTVGTNFAWTRAFVNNISNPAASGTGDPNEVLVNTGTDTVHVTYTYTLSAYGCTNPSTYDVVVVVAPTPLLTSIQTPAAICDSTVFDYTPTSLTPGTTFAWTRAAVTDIANAAAVGIGNPMEYLDNTTADPVTVTYVYTLTAYGCINPTTYSVDVVVNPTPYLNTTLTPAPICNNTVFNYAPASNTVGTTFAWSRAAVTGISNVAATGTDDPNETLENTTTAPIDVVYEYTMTANGCSHTEFVTVTVYPSVTVADAGTDIGPLNATSTLLGASQPAVGTGNWSLGTGPNTPVIVDPTLFNTVVSGLVPGTYSFVWTITSPWNCPSSTDTVNVIINHPPVAVDDSATTNVNVAVAITITDNDTDSDGNIVPSTVAVITQPANGTVLIHPTTGVATYTPNTNFIGIDNFTYTIEDNDGGVSNIANVVIAVYERPDAVDDDTMTMTGQSVNIAILANDILGSAPLDPSTIVIHNDVDHGITMVDPATGLVLYTPTNGYYGTDHFTYSVRDTLNSLSDTANVTIRIYKAPVAVNDAVFTDEELPVTIDMVANDTAFGIALNKASIVVTTQPAHGTVQIFADGTAIYSPAIGYFGQDFYNYTVKDNNGFTSNMARVDITIISNKPDLMVMKTITTPVDKIAVGEDIEFNVTIANNGKLAATGVVMTDILADNLGGKNVRVIAENGTAVYNENTKTITWTIPTLAVNESVSLRAIMQVTTGGDIINVATAKCKEDETIVTNNASTAFADMSGREDLFIPNVITVNGDGKNDNFMVLGLEKYPGAEFMVFNRWGNMVYESKDYKNNWDGFGLNEGTYYYVLKVNKYGVVKNYSGWVQVLR